MKKERHHVERTKIRTRGKRFGTWQITDTISSTRKNLFCIDPAEGFHIGTIVSGSQSKLERFERSLSLIRTAPEMLHVLEMVAAALTEDSSFDRISLLSEIESVLCRATSPLKSD